MYYCYLICIHLSSSLSSNSSSSPPPPPSWTVEILCAIRPVRLDLQDAYGLSIFISVFPDHCIRSANNNRRPVLRDFLLHFLWYFSYLSDGIELCLNPVFFRLGSANGCWGLGETEMRNGERVLLALLNFYVRIKIRVATFGTNRSIIDSTPTVNRCFSPEVSWFLVKSFSRADHREYRNVRRNDQVRDRYEVIRWLCTRNVHILIYLINYLLTYLIT